MKAPSLRFDKGYSVGEEIAHSVTHGIGALLSIAGLVIMVTLSATYGNAWDIVSSSIYGFTLILLYSTSTLYHAITKPDIKDVLRKIDHAVIYLLIAGTYTPFTLISLRGAWGWSLFGIVWSIAIAGMVMELLMKQRIRWISVSLYLGLGWAIVIATKPLMASVATGGLSLLLLGGLAYTFGVIFYAWKRLAYHHAIWHVFVMAGSALHYFAILFYVIPNHA
jgi:hemolysin III